jgi:hypothetical protein
VRRLVGVELFIGFAIIQGPGTPSLLAQLGVSGVLWLDLGSSSEGCVSNMSRVRYSNIWRIGRWVRWLQWVAKQAVIWLAESWNAVESN